MQIINDKLLNSVSEQAKESPRLRMNYNFHKQLDDPAQCLLNALEPGTQLPIHRHTDTAETYILLRGKINVIFYSETKEETEIISLDSATGNYGINIPVDTWHTLDVLESGSVIFEVKDGPYTPLNEEDVLQ
jgi:cupin fold WbuC family metalloprotein